MTPWLPAGTVYGTLLNFRREWDLWSPRMTQDPHKAAPKAPVLYVKTANTFCPAGQDLLLQDGVSEVDIGATLGLVIGAQARVVGAVLLNDWSVPHTSYYRPPVKFRCRDGFLALPEQVTTGQLRDWAALQIEVRRNGERVQSVDLRNLVRVMPTLLADVGEFMTPQPGDVLMVGAMAGLSILKVLQEVAPGMPGIAMLMIAIIGAIPVCIAVNVLIERVAYRRLRNAPRLAPLITAIGVSILVQTFAMMIWGRSPVSFPPIMPTVPVQIGGAVISQIQILLLVLATVAMIGLVLLVEKTKMGRAMRATAENPRVAGLMGVDSNKVIVATFAIGAALAAIAGVMWTANYSSAQFAMGFVPGLKAFSAAVLGGIGNIYGAMVGGILLGLIESLGAGYIGDLTGGILGSQYQDIFAFVVLIIVLTLRPSGIMGERVADRA